MRLPYLLGLGAVYVLSLAATAALALVVVMLLAGPHTGLLPQWMEQAVLALGWLAVLGVPVLVTSRVHRRWGGRSR